MAIFSPSSLFRALGQESKPATQQEARVPTEAPQPVQEAPSILPDDKVHLHVDELPAAGIRPPLNLGEYKFNVGREMAYIKETLRNKISEYGLPERTQLSLAADALGNLRVEGRLPEAIRERITEDLNNDRALKATYARLSQEAPTLEYVDKVMKITSTYGVGNNLFNTIVSERSEHNGLNDLSLRMGRVRQTVLETFQKDKDAPILPENRFSISA